MGVCSRKIALMLLLMTAIAWGGMYHVAKDTLTVIDAYWLVFIRYVVTALVFTLILIRSEGLSALRLEGNGWVLWWYGTMGFAVFNYLVFLGLAMSSSEHAAVISGLMPMMSLLVAWVSEGQRPPTATLITLSIALLGVVLVVSRGNIDSLIDQESVMGDAMIFLGAFSWVIYTRGALRFKQWSSLRYTTITTLGGMISILAITGSLSWVGVATVPQVSQLFESMASLIYIVVIATIIGVLCWNYGIRSLGILNGMLFINLIPISTLAIGVFFGHVLVKAEIVGCVLVLGSLFINNLLARRQIRVVNSSR